MAKPVLMCHNDRAGLSCSEYGESGPWGGTKQKTVSRQPVFSVWTFSQEPGASPVSVQGGTLAKEAKDC